ncbi:amino acid deaminase [Devosia algicola]|uniref:Amino acid deaminase n=1 Tax=Devosia algicola TaxID=3026418 RepID=A0ABY7YMQ4_9HYPH|nr:amino acid deaminase [Devosia algicola]WDR02591.1 amino acid deaminase [Devosia algicola]
MLDLSEITSTILDGRTKGLPGTASPFKLADVGLKRWNVLAEDLPLPLMVLKRSALDYNANLFADYLTQRGLSLAPHGKTTMCPQIFDEQLRNGAWAISAATANQAHTMHHFGVRRIILANQLVGKTNIAMIAQLLAGDPDFEFYCFLDSRNQLQQLQQHLAGKKLRRPVRLLIEIGAKGGRTGVRDLDTALALEAAIRQCDADQLAFAGLSAFEGALPGLDQGSNPVSDFADFVVKVAQALPPEAFAKLDQFIMSGGGSAYFDMIADRFAKLDLAVPTRIVLRSGCYVTNDHGAYHNLQEAARRDPNRHWNAAFQPALEAWSYVQSIPEPGLAFLTMGKRDIPFDAGLPLPIKRYRPGVGFLDVGKAEIFNTNDQHAYVRLGEGMDWQVGDMIGSGISHPCTAFDKWHCIPVVDDGYDVIDAMLTFF